MMDYRGRLVAVVDEVSEAFQVFRGILTLGETYKLPPDQRVALANSAIVALASVIEEGVRELLKEYMSLLEQTAPLSTDLRKALFVANVERGALSISKFKRFEDLGEMAAAAQMLAAFLGGTEAPKLFKGHLSRNEQNLRWSHLCEVTKRIGIDDISTKLCDSDEMGILLGGEKIELRVEILRARWDEFVEERNLVVHSISRASGWSEVRVLAFSDFAQRVLRRLVDVLEKDLEEQALLCAQKAKRRGIEGTAQ